MSTQPPTLNTSPENAGIDISPISPADRRNSLEKHLQTRPEEQDLKNRHILLDTNAAPSLQAKALELERQRATDNLKKGLGKRPERGELVDREFDSSVLFSTQSVCCLGFSLGGSEWVSVSAVKLCCFSMTGHANAVFEGPFSWRSMFYSFFSSDRPCQHSQDVQKTSLLTSTYTLVMPRAREFADLTLQPHR